MFKETRKRSIIKSIVMIKKIGSKYVVVAESGRQMGTYNTKKEAETRLREIEFFKEKKKKK